MPKVPKPEGGKFVYIDHQEDRERLTANPESLAGHALHRPIEGLDGRVENHSFIFELSGAVPSMAEARARAASTDSSGVRQRRESARSGLSDSSSDDSVDGGNGRHSRTLSSAQQRRRQQAVRAHAEAVTLRQVRTKGHRTAEIVADSPRETIDPHLASLAGGSAVRTAVIDEEHVLEKRFYREAAQCPVYTPQYERRQPEELDGPEHAAKAGAARWYPNTKHSRGWTVGSEEVQARTRGDAAVRPIQMEKRLVRQELAVADRSVHEQRKLRHKLITERPEAPQEPSVPRRNVESAKTSLASTLVNATSLQSSPNRRPDVETTLLAETGGPKVPRPSSSASHSPNRRSRRSLSTPSHQVGEVTSSPNRMDGTSSIISSIISTRPHQQSHSSGRTEKTKIVGVAGVAREQLRRPPDAVLVPTQERRFGVPVGVVEVDRNGSCGESVSPNLAGQHFSPPYQRDTSAVAGASCVRCVAKHQREAHSAFEARVAELEARSKGSTPPPIRPGAAPGQGSVTRLLESRGPRRARSSLGISASSATSSKEGLEHPPMRPAGPNPTDDDAYFKRPPKPVPVSLGTISSIRRRQEAERQPPRCSHGGDSASPCPQCDAVRSSLAAFECLAMESAIAREGSGSALAKPMGAEGGEEEDEIEDSPTDRRQEHRPPNDERSERLAARRDPAFRAMLAPLRARWQQAAERLKGEGATPHDDGSAVGDGHNLHDANTPSSQHLQPGFKVDEALCVGPGGETGVPGGISITLLFHSTTHRDREDLYISVVGGLSLDMNREKFRTMARVLAPRAGVRVVTDEQLSVLFNMFDINRGGTVSFFEYLTTLCDHLLSPTQHQFIRFVFNYLVEEQGAKHRRRREKEERATMKAAQEAEAAAAARGRRSSAMHGGGGAPKLPALPVGGGSPSQPGEPSAGTPPGRSAKSPRGQKAGSPSWSPEDRAGSASPSSPASAPRVTAATHVHVYSPLGRRRESNAAVRRGMRSSSTVYEPELCKADMDAKTILHAILKYQGRSRLFPHPPQESLAGVMSTCFDDLSPVDSVAAPKFTLLLFCDGDVMEILSGMVA